MPGLDPYNFEKGSPRSLGVPLRKIVVSKIIQQGGGIRSEPESLPVIHFSIAVALLCVEDGCQKSQGAEVIGLRFEGKAQSLLRLQKLTLFN